MKTSPVARWLVDAVKPPSFGLIGMASLVCAFVANPRVAFAATSATAYILLTFAVWAANDEDEEPPK